MTHHLVVTQNITLDGRIEFLDDWFDPSPQDQDVERPPGRDEPSGGCSSGECCSGAGRSRTSAATGRSTRTSPPGASLERLQKYVVSRTLGDPGWQNSTVLSGEPLDEVRRLKDSGEGDLVVTGSITLTHAILAAGLVDELRLFVYPAIQGRGRGLVSEDVTLLGLTPVESRMFRGGVTLLRYVLGQPCPGRHEAG